MQIMKLFPHKCKSLTTEEKFPVNTESRSLEKHEWTLLSGSIQSCIKLLATLPESSPPVLIFSVTEYPDPINLLFASFTPESSQGLTQGIQPQKGCCLSVGWDKAVLGAGESTEQRAQAAAGEAASTGRAAADDHGWELHVAQPKFLSWQQLFVETEGVLKKAPFYGPCDNNCECCNVITHVSELQCSDVSLLAPSVLLGKGRLIQNKPHPCLL